MAGLRLVPFNASWIQHDKLDLHAIYKRPRWVMNDLDEQVQERDANGQPVYDITSPLPVRQHNKWVAKGFVYVTLATRADLRQAFEKGTLVDEAGNLCSWREFDQHQSGGPWHIKLYQQGEQSSASTYMEDLEAQVAQFGSAAVEAIRRSADPHFVLPARLRNIQPRTASVAAAPAAAEAVPAPKNPAPSVDPAPDKAPRPRARQRNAGARAGDAELVGGFDR